MAKPYISPEEGQELTRLWQEYDKATKEASAALLSPPHGQFEGEKKNRFLAADGRATEAINRIREILGE